jgi:hypothetical protein
MDGSARVIDPAYSPTSPFAGGLRSAAAAGESRDTEAWSLTTPFSTGMRDTGRSESEEAMAALVAELDEEEFDEAVQALVDDAARRHLAMGEVWSSEATDHLAAGDVESWMAGIAAEADRFLEHLEQRFATRTPESVTASELEAVIAEARAGAPDLGGEQFFGALVRKARKLASGAAALARRGIAFAGRNLLLGPLFTVVRKIVPLLLKRVLAVGFNHIPPHLQKDAAALARRFGVPVPASASELPTTSGAVLAELFDTELADAVLTGRSPEGEQGEQGEQGEADGAVAHLDAARAELAGRLAEAEAGSVLTSEIEQFVPAVMAVLPLVRTGIRLAGRDRVVGLLARPLAELIKGHVGPEATKALSRVIADKGLGLLGLEAELGGTLGAEALASAVEDTIRAVGELPAEAQDEPLRVGAEVQEAFAEAVARHLPAELLRADIDANEVDGESAVWVLMPRGPRRRYRYRKYCRAVPVRLSRPVARAIVLSDGGTLEQRLLDEGVAAWPAEAEVHLYEALPGTHAGHLAAGEGSTDAGEFEELVPATAALLLRRPGAGRGASGVPRYYRVVARHRPGAHRHRRHRRMVLHLLLAAGRPTLHLHLHLSEREAHRIGELLEARADVRLVAAFRSLVRGVVAALPERLVRRAARIPGLTLGVEQAQRLAAAIGERMVTAVAAQLRGLGPALATATRDPAPGVTLTFAFGFADPSALAAGRPDVPVVTVRPGRAR